MESQSTLFSNILVFVHLGFPVIQQQTKFWTICAFFVIFFLPKVPQIVMPYSSLDIIQALANSFLVFTDAFFPTNFKAPSLFLHFEKTASLPVSK